MASTPLDSVWADQWNPDVNEWSPSDEPLGATPADTVHGDVALAPTMSEEYGQPPAGTVPDVRANLLTDVRQSATPPTAPSQIIRHEVQTYEAGAEAIRARQVMVNGNVSPTVLLNPDPNRRRALIRVFTSAQTILLNGINDGGGNLSLNGTPNIPLAQWPLRDTDGTMEIKSQAGIEAYGIGPGASVAVSIWEELIRENAVPGVGI